MQKNTRKKEDPVQVGNSLAMVMMMMVVMKMMMMMTMIFKVET